MRSGVYAISRWFIFPNSPTRYQWRSLLPEGDSYSGELERASDVETAFRIAPKGPIVKSKENEYEI